MRTITVCVGSSCHMKGSHHAVDKLAELIEKYDLQNQVELKASFCMNQCKGNIGLRIDDKQVTDMTEDNVEEVFNREILQNN